jgi:predicted Zn-dependent protease with MMP-like domain
MVISWRYGRKSPGDCYDDATLPSTAMSRFTDEHRRLFDEQLELVLAELPPLVKKLMDDVPLVVDDFPSPEIMRRARVCHPGQLCGLYTGIPLIHRSVDQSGVPSDVIHLFRLGILNESRCKGAIEVDELRRQIRKTILHEYGHHHGLTERDLRELGYG